MTLTPRERATVEAIRVSVTGRGYPPSIRELGDLIGLKSTASVQYVLASLERKGAIRRVAGQSRAITIVEESPACS